MNKENINRIWIILSIPMIRIIIKKVVMIRKIRLIMDYIKSKYYIMDDKMIRKIGYKRWVYINMIGAIGIGTYIGYKIGREIRKPENELLQTLFFLYFPYEYIVNFITHNN